jgi:hypothetical protein
MPPDPLVHLRGRYPWMTHRDRDANTITVRALGSGKERVFTQEEIHACAHLTKMLGDAYEALLQEIAAELHAKVIAHE